MKQWVANGARWDATSYPNHASPFIRTEDSDRLHIALPGMAYWIQMADFFSRMLAIPQPEDEEEKKKEEKDGDKSTNKAIRRLVMPWARCNILKKIQPLLLLRRDMSFLSMPHPAWTIMSAVSNIASHSLHTLIIGEINCDFITPLMNRLCWFPSLHTLVLTIDPERPREPLQVNTSEPVVVASIKRLFLNVNHAPPPPSSFPPGVWFLFGCDYHIWARGFPNLEVLGISLPPLNVFKGNTPFDFRAFISLKQLYAIQSIDRDYDGFNEISSSSNIIPFIKVSESCSVSYRVDALEKLDYPTVVKLHSAFMDSPAVRFAPNQPGVSRQVAIVVNDSRTLQVVQFWMMKAGVAPQLLPSAPERWMIASMPPVTPTLPPSLLATIDSQPPDVDYLRLARYTIKDKVPSSSQSIHPTASRGIDVTRWRRFLAAFMPICGDGHMEDYFVIVA